MVTDEEWKAIIENDATYDDTFCYAVKTTKIYCRPSCSSRIPKRENIEIYYDLKEPGNYGYRPCKRCRPDDVVVDDNIWVEELSYTVHGSQSHLRHVLKNN